VCLSGDPTASLCGPIVEAVTDGLIGWGQCAFESDDRVAVYGLIPDLAGLPVFAMPGGQTQPANIVNGVVYDTFARDSLPTALEWEGSSSTQSRPLQFPPDVNEVVCGPE
jgi:hypothetical protein